MIVINLKIVHYPFTTIPSTTLHKQKVQHHTSKILSKFYNNTIKKQFLVINSPSQNPTKKYFFQKDESIKRLKKHSKSASDKQKRITHIC
jgi:hypothetical protein